MIILRKIVLVVAIAWLWSGSLVQAQAIAPPPGGMGSVDYLTQIQNLTDAMVSTHIGTFVAEGLSMQQSIAAIMLVYMLIMALFSRAAALEKFVEFVFLYLIAYSMLTFYDSPMPWGNGSSFHSIFADEARWIDGTIDLSILNSLALACKNILTNTTAPIGIDVMGWFTYMGVVVDVTLLWFFSFGITAASYVALGVGSILGPLLIPFLIWPFMSFLFTGWLRYMIIYSLWRVMATAVVAVFANVALWFINTIIAGDLSLGHMLAVLPAWTAIILASLYVLWISHSLARDMVSGSASMGNAMSVAAGAVAAAILK